MLVPLRPRQGSAAGSQINQECIYNKESKRIGEIKNNQNFGIGGGLDNLTDEEEEVVVVVVEFMSASAKILSLKTGIASNSLAMFPIGLLPRTSIKIARTTSNIIDSGR